MEYTPSGDQTWLAGTSPIKIDEDLHLGVSSMKMFHYHLNG